MAKPRMTVTEVTNDLRACGEQTSEAAVRVLIINGQYPFGTAFRMPHSSRWSFRIYRKDYEEWKASKGLCYIEKPVQSFPKEQAAIDKFYQDYPEFKRKGA